MTSSYEDIISQCVSLSLEPSNEFFEEWDQLDCHGAMSSKISSGNGSLVYVEDNQQYVENSMTQILNNYSTVYQFTSDTKSPAFSNFQYQLLSACIDPSLPGVCDTFLESYCSDVTRQDATDDNFLGSMCGCYVPPDEDYLQYTTGNEECLDGLPGCVACTGDECFGQPACDPLCHKALTIQKANKTRGSLIGCPQNICVIDISNASVSKDDTISFTNVCTGCQEGDGCMCVVNTPDSLQTNVYSLCGPDSVYITNGVVTGAPVVKQTEKSRITYGIILVCVIVLISVITYSLIKHGSNTRRLRHSKSSRSEETKD